MTKIIIVGPASPLRGGISDFNEYEKIFNDWDSGFVFLQYQLRR